MSKGQTDESTVYDVISDSRALPKYTYRLSFPPSLQNLKEVELDSGAQGETWTIATATRFSQFPSLRSLSVSRIDDSRQNLFDVNLEAVSSNVEHLRFESCTFGDKITYNFLRGFPKLRSLEWGNERLPQAAGLMPLIQTRGLPDNFWLGAALQAHNKDTLETLKVRSTASITETDFIGDIPGLSKLRDLEIGVGGLIDFPDIDEALLPKSLVELCIEFDDIIDEYGTVRDYCKGLATNKSRDHPSLTRIALKYHVGSSELKSLIQKIKGPDYIDLELCCISQGVSLSVRCDDGEYDCRSIWQKAD